MKKANFLDWNNNILINSLKKIDLNIILVLILDTLFYLLSGYIVLFWLQRVQSNIANFNLPQNIVSMGYERAQELVSEVRTFYYLIIASFILLLIAIIFLASILKGIIWAKTIKSKISFNLISKFLVLNLIWMGFWFVIILLISLFVQQQSVPMFMLITIILGLFFTNTIYTIFMKNPSLKAIPKAIKLNISKIHLFLLPYTIILLLIFIIVKLNNLFTFRYSAILYGLIVIVYAALVRYYTSTLVLGIEKK